MTTRSEGEKIELCEVCLEDTDKVKECQSCFKHFCSECSAKNSNAFNICIECAKENH